MTLNDRFLATVMDAKRIVLIDAKANDKPAAIVGPDMEPDDGWGVPAFAPTPDTNFTEDEELI